MLNHEKILEAEKLLKDLLGPELAEVIKRAAADPGSFDSYMVEIPEPTSVDFSPEELASVVARASNMFGRMTRWGGMARAELKIAEAQYKRKYKAHKKGANESEREANAVLATESEAAVVNLLESVVEIVESAEIHLRIASESARKLLDKVATMDIAQRRESHGQYLPKDFN